MESVTLLDAAPLDLAVWRSELALAVTTALGLLVGANRPRARWLVALAGLAVTVGLAMPPWPAGTVSPLGPHLQVDGVTVTARLLLAGLALLTLASWPAARGAAAPYLTLWACGLLLMVESASMTALLLGCVLAGLGAVSLRHGLGDHVASIRSLVGLGFAVAAMAGVLWCGLGGSTDLAAARDGLAARPSLPALALPLILGLLLLGLSLSVLAPLRMDGSRQVMRWAPWCVSGPLVALAIVPQRMLVPMPQAPLLEPAPLVVLALGGLLTIGGFAAALGRLDPARRLLDAAPALLGLAWLGFALVVPDDAWRAALVGLLLAAMTMAAALILLAGPPPGTLRRLGLTVALLGLAPVPPLVAWRPRFATIEALLAGDALVACGLASLGTLLGFVVFLRPVASLWRGAPSVPTADDVNPAGRVLAWVVLVGAVAWGLGLAPLWPATG